MRFLLDTHILIWAADEAPQLSKTATALLEDDSHQLSFSVISIWEIAIKRALGQPNFLVEPGLLRASTLSSGYSEISFNAAHALMVPNLALIHKDPFDRALIAQARAENMVLLTSDREVARYGDNVQLI